MRRGMVAIPRVYGQSGKSEMVWSEGKKKIERPCLGSDGGENKEKIENSNETENDGKGLEANGEVSITTI